MGDPYSFRLHLQVGPPRPYFAELAYYLWGEVNYDSEGNCTKPTDQKWTRIYLMNRLTREKLLMGGEGRDWEIRGGDAQTVSRLAMFFAERCGAVVDRSELSAGADWDHAAAMARTARVRREFEQPVLRLFDNHWFWGSWKWVGWFASDLTEVGRWIMHSLVRNNPRGIPLCIHWMEHAHMRYQQPALCFALKRLSGEPSRPPWQWVAWYNGTWFKKGANRRYPMLSYEAITADLKQEWEAEIGNTEK